MGLIVDRLGPRTRKALIAYAVVAPAWRFARDRLATLRAQMSYAVSVASNDPLYAALHAWLLEAMDPDRRRALTVRSPLGSGLLPRYPGDIPEPSNEALGVFYDAVRPQQVRLGPYAVTVTLERADADRVFVVQDGHFTSNDRLVLTTATTGGRDAILELLEKLYQDAAKRPPSLRSTDRWGQWSGRSGAVTRPLATVVLPAGKREHVVADLEAFLASEQACARLGIPWHRGYLFTGPPGTGKTSLAKGIATHFGLNVNYISLSIMEDDGRLAEALQNIGPRSVLVLEDIDVVHGARERDDRSRGVTLAGLLNVLDGFLTPHGLITIMTSNNAEVLDPALVRPGRVDYRLDLGPLDQHQLEELVANFCGTSKPLPAMKRPLLPADIVGVMKDHMGDPEAARKAVVSLLRSAPT